MRWVREQFHRAGWLTDLASSGIRRTAVTAVCLVSLIGVSGCGGQESAEEGSVSPGSMKVGVTPKPGGGTSAVGGDQDLTKVVCAPDANGEWTFRGILTNSTAHLSHYTVSVSVANRDTGALFGTASQAFAVKPHSTLTVEFTSIADSQGADLSRITCENLVTVLRDVPTS